MNFTYFDTATNKSVNEKAPCEYFRTVFNDCGKTPPMYGNITDMKALLENLEENCIQKEIVSMDYERYDDFLMERRRLMAKKIKDYYNRL